MLEPADGWLAELPEEFTGRQVRAGTVADARALNRPTFVKPPRDKSFPADVYTDGSRLSPALDPATPVLRGAGRPPVRVICPASPWPGRPWPGSTTAGPGRQRRRGRCQAT
ncbi:hypothetical protein [Streptomyces collinus]|uniref:hypothetical protein n=1 Tax=Streptomyces collinus TaxID=42684 RepID=UPI003808904F